MNVIYSLLSYTDPPDFINPELPVMCKHVHDNVTYNCSELLMVVGNPPPNLTANVTGSGIGFSILSPDAVMITGTDHHVATVKCIADNGIEPAAIATGYVNFGSEDKASSTCTCIINYTK